MTPLEAFQSVWRRADEVRTLHVYLAANVTSALHPEELLRAEWVGRVSALDLYIHEIVAKKMAETFAGLRPEAKGFAKFQVGAATLTQMRGASPVQAASLFDLEVRSRHSVLSFQHPDRIADAIRLISDVELWNEVAFARGAGAQKVQGAKTLKKQLSLIVERRNKIAHEGDLQPTVPRVEWPIVETDVEFVKVFIANLVTTLDAVIV